MRNLLRPECTQNARAILGYDESRETYQTMGSFVSCQRLSAVSGKALNDSPTQEEGTLSPEEVTHGKLCVNVDISSNLLHSC